MVCYLIAISLTDSDGETHVSISTVVYILSLPDTEHTLSLSIQRVWNFQQLCHLFTFSRTLHLESLLNVTVAWCQTILSYPERGEKSTEEGSPE